MPARTLNGCEIRFRKTRKAEVEAQIGLSKLLELARDGRQPDSDYGPVGDGPGTVYGSVSVSLRRFWVDCRQDRLG
jgi:hypothetical protein